MDSASKVTMLNPKNHVIIVTNLDFQSKWEQLGFIVVNNLLLFKTALAS